MTVQDSFDNQNPPPLTQPSPQVPLAPPTSPAPYVPPRRESSWPTAIGVITVILGVFYILGSLARVANVFELTSQRGPNRPPEWAATQLPLPWQIIATIASLVLALLIVPCGIMLFERKRAAVIGVKVWAVAYTLLAVINLTMNCTMTTAAMQKAEQNATAAGAPRGFVTGVMFAGMCFSSLFTLALPVFMLIWFSRRKIKDEVAAWS